MRTSLILLSMLTVFVSRAEAAQQPNYEIIARLAQAPGNVTVTGSGRIIMSQHQFYEPNYSVVEHRDDGSLAPFPNKEFNDRLSHSELKLDSVLGIRSDANGVVWMLDNGMRSGVTPKLVGWDTKADKLHRVIYLPPPIAPKDAFVNDFTVDGKHNKIFIADPAGGANAAFIVVDLQTGAARRVLEGHSSVVPEKIDLVIDGHPIQAKDSAGHLVRPHIGVNPITEDLQNEWVYFGPMHGTSLYRIKAADLANEALGEAELGARVERYSAKPICDGISIDRDNNIYLGDLAENAIGVIKGDRSYQRLAQDEELSWVDSLSFGPGGKLYAVVNRLHKSAVLNGGESLSKPPYFLIEVKAMAPGLAGR
ncbi:L-dopachrome tautomerase-related protein [Methylocystis sp. SB2]|uniref:L-dopachrome tautomerase-related protein n=1 Tax=Methylocystis sp. (strain SB2) TaxID=743836 RepID=UPI0003FCD312|nr:L-dopachrome tautomerase-related protein [Methylocystis sp. SB2]ULO23798.1 major royal jelly family protein [Methylocystis sp. SB2]